MAAPEEGTPAPGAVSRAGEVDVAALFAELSEEVRRLGGPTGANGASSTRVDARAVAARLWPVTADRPPAGRQGAAGAALKPVKLTLRRLMRWYVEPALADQRAVNDALIRLVDDLYERVDRLERALAEAQSEQR
jgi:hypothetical protein